MPSSKNSTNCLDYQDCVGDVTVAPPAVIGKSRTFIDLFLQKNWKFI